jgi:tetratricopeptide (TPR) repeat protein
MALGRFDEAVAKARYATDLDPLAETPRFVLCRVLYMARRYEESIEEIVQALQFEDGVARMYFVLASCYAKVDRLADAVDAARRGLTYAPGQPFATALLAYMYGLAGQHAEARTLLAALEDDKTRYISPYYLAMVHVGLGDNDRAFACFEQAMTARPSFMAYIGVAPVLDPIRSDARFDDFLARMQLR